MNLNKLKGQAIAWMSAKSPEILSGLAIAGLVGTIALTVRATLKVEKALKEAEERKGEKLDLKETAKEVWKPIAPVVASAVATGACVIASHTIEENRKAALMAAYTMAQGELDTYKKKFKEVCGEEAAEEVTKEVDKERVVSYTPDQVFFTNTDGCICFDPMSGRYFRSNKNTIVSAVNRVNQNIIDSWSAVLNDFYEELGLPACGLGDDLGWNTNNLLRVDFDTALTPGGDPVLVLNYKVYPEYRLL